VKARALLAGEWLLAMLVRAMFLVMRGMGSRIGPSIGAAVARGIGPFTPTQRIVLGNLRLAFPEHDEAWITATAREAWDNLGRTACEYVHLPAILAGTTPEKLGPRLEADAATEARFQQLRREGRPVLVFGAHLANWELPAVVAHAIDQNAAILYRTPNNRFIAAYVTAKREPIMGRLIPAGIAAPIRMAEALDSGMNLGMLIDQRFGRGPQVPFFGHPVAANPFLARLAGRFDAPVYGMRAIRLPHGRFRIMLEGPFELPRDSRGKIDVPAATAFLNQVIEGWVREHPGQWLWMHRRWRG
jgi:KDO2-lipid IV(A) lauroyltransferase